jgi:hypothetical protein
MFHSNSPVRKHANTRASSAAIVLGGALIGQPTSVIAEVSYPWCTQGETLQCYYMTREQCEQTVDYHGFCVANPAAPRTTHPCSDLIRRQDTADVRNENEPVQRSAAKLLTKFSEAPGPSVRCGIRSVACRLHLPSIAMKRPFGSRLY